MNVGTHLWRLAEVYYSGRFRAKIFLGDLGGSGGIWGSDGEAISGTSRTAKKYGAPLGVAPELRALAERLEAYLEAELG